MWNRQRSVHVNTSVLFGIICFHFSNTAEVTASVVTYLQYENIHMIFVIVSNKRTVVIARPKSSLFMYTSRDRPVNILQKHITTVIMYTV